MINNIGLKIALDGTGIYAMERKVGAGKGQQEDMGGRRLQDSGVVF